MPGRRSMTDEQLAEAISVTLRRVFETEDPTVILVRGAIAVDSLLERCLDKRLHRGYKPLRESKSFAHDRLLLARAVGLLSEVEFQLIDGLNRLRNSVAHHFEAEIRPQDQQALEELARKHGIALEALDNVKAGGGFTTWLKWLISVLVALLMTRPETIAPIEVQAPEPDEKFWNEATGTSVVLQILSSRENRPIVALIVLILASIANWFARVNKPQRVDSETSTEPSDVFDDEPEREARSNHRGEGAEDT